MNYTFEIVITEDDLREMIAKQYGVSKEMVHFSAIVYKNASNDHTLTCTIRKQGKVSQKVIDIFMNEKGENK